MTTDDLTAAPLVTRRTTLKGLGAASLAALTVMSAPAASLAQDATPTASTDIPTVAFTAKDFEFLDLPASIPAGHTRLSMTSEGPADHHAIFMRLNDGLTVDDFTAALQSGDLGQLLATGISYGGPGSISPGVTSDVVVDLPAGQYVVVCLIPDEETGMPHAAMGMLAPLEVTEATVDTAPPPIDGVIDLADFEFMGLPMEVAAGRYTWAVQNAGEQLHELVLYKMADGVPYAVAESIFLAPPAATPAADTGAAAEATPVEAASPEAAGPPPFAAIAGVAPITPGLLNYMEVELTPGEHFAICFIPDPETGAPHFALGMIMPFAVA